jgi:RNA polymerase sigma factor (sigma-70 family)
VPPLDAATARWFETELQPHTPRLRAWLRSQFPGAADADDLVQEAVLLVLRAHASAPVRSPKAYLFVVARNLAVSARRREAVRRTGSLEEIAAWSLPDETTDVRHEVARAQELEMLGEAIQRLPTRCRQVLTLRKLYGLSQRETATQLGISEHTVEIHTATGLQKINRFFRARRSA